MILSSNLGRIGLGGAMASVCLKVLQPYSRQPTMLGHDPEAHWLFDTGRRLSSSLLTTPLRSSSPAKPSVLEGNLVRLLESDSLCLKLIQPCVQLKKHGCARGQHVFGIALTMIAHHPRGSFFIAHVLPAMVLVVAASSRSRGVSTLVDGA